MTRRLLLLNGLAVVGAVLNHAAGWGFTSLFWWTDRYEAVTVPDFSRVGSPAYYGLRAVEQLIAFGVPAFLFVSGYFVAFAAGRDRVLGWNRVRGRLRMLLLPYVLWSVAIFAGRVLEGTTDTAAGYLGQLAFGQAAAPYYYIPLMTQLFLMSPLIVAAVTRHGRTMLVGAAVLQGIVLTARYPVLLGWDLPAAAWVAQRTPGWFFPYAGFWFVFGVFAGFNGAALKERLSRWRPALPWVVAACGIAGFVEWELLFRLSGTAWLNPMPTLLDSLYAGTFILAFLAFTPSTSAVTRSLDRVGERSFGVYLIHAPVLELMARASYHVTPALLEHQLLFQSLLVACGVAVPLVLMAAVRRSPVRPAYNYLFG